MKYRFELAQAIIKPTGSRGNVVTPPVRTMSLVYIQNIESYVFLSSEYNRCNISLQIFNCNEYNDVIG